MKRSIDDDEFRTLDLARCLVMLSQGSKEAFQCKTCNRQFPSFQALGGHRASHKRLRLSETTLAKEVNDVGLALSLTVKPKMHECQICSQKFSMGQALGGHMRRHRAEMIKHNRNMVFSVASTVPVLMRSNSIKRVMPLDLNLTPLENDLKMLLKNMASK